jgi:transcription-repair coupling factor (superfamily II helicase)
MRDRYGEPPAQVRTLVSVSRLRRRIAELSITELVTAGPNLRIVGPELLDSRQARLVRLYSGARYVNALSAALIPMSSREGDDLIEWVRDIVEAIYGETT